MLAIETKGLTKRFNGKTVVDQLDLQVPKGTVFGFLGPNGAGKTTTIRMLMGFALPSGGSARILDQAADKAREKVGFVPDVPAFYPWMEKEEYLRFSGNLLGLGGTSLEKRIGELLEMAGLSGVTPRIGGFSRGMKQRLGLAQALINHPELVILDEPTSALDPVGRKEVLEMIARFSGQTTVFFSTHILSDVERVADRVGILHQGRLILEDSLVSLKESYVQPRLVLTVTQPWDQLEAALDSTPWISEWDREENRFILTVQELEVAYHRLPSLLSQMDTGIKSLEVSGPTLEEVFVKLVTET